MNLIDNSTRLCRRVGSCVISRPVVFNSAHFRKETSWLELRGQCPRRDREVEVWRGRVESKLR